MKAIRLTNEKGELIDIANDLGALQSEVEGLIQPIMLGNKIAMIVNEEGKLRDYAVNEPATDIFQHYIYYSDDFIVGTALIVGVDGEEFTDLSERQITEISELLKSYGYYKKED